MKADTPKSVLILGGAKSGKSSLAQRMAEGWPGRRFFVATAQAWDQEMERRIHRHQLDRGPDWTTVEEPVELPDAIARVDSPDSVILVDCLTLWLSNLMTQQMDTESEILDRFAELGRVVEKISGRVILVANEVGMGIVPDNALARLYRDLAGGLNQKLGRVCKQVIFVAAGLPMVLKGQAIQTGDD